MYCFVNLYISKIINVELWTANVQIKILSFIIQSTQVHLHILFSWKHLLTCTKRHSFQFWFLINYFNNYPELCPLPSHFLFIISPTGSSAFLNYSAGVKTIRLDVFLKLCGQVLMQSSFPIRFSNYEVPSGKTNGNQSV